MSEDIKPQYNTGDQVTISRGKLRGQDGKVIAVNEQGQKYAVQTADDITVVSFGAVKAKQEPTIGRTRLERDLVDFGISPETAEQFVISVFGEDS